MFDFSFSVPVRLGNRTIGVNLAIFHGVLGTVDINMPPLQGWILLLNVFL